MAITAKDKLQRVRVAIERTQRRINRNHNALVKLQRQEKRLAKLAAVGSAVRAEDLEDRLYVKPVEFAKPPKPDVVEKSDDPLDVRNQPWARQPNAADEKAKAEIRAGQLARVKIKAKASSEKSRAKKRGELRRMPLTGKAALAKINAE